MAQEILFDDLGEVAGKDLLPKEWLWSPKEEGKQDVKVLFRAPHIMECFSLLEDITQNTAAAPKGNTVEHWRAVIPCFGRAIKATMVEPPKGETGEDVFNNLLDQFEFVDVVLMATLVLRKLHSFVGFATVKIGEEKPPFSVAPEPSLPS